MEYKVGDKVRILKSGHLSVKNGDIKTVESILGDTIVMIRSSSGLHVAFYTNEIEPAYEEGELVDLNLNDGDVVQWTGNGVRGTWAYPYVGEIRLVGKYGSGSVAGVQKHSLHEYTGIWRVISRAEVSGNGHAEVKYTSSKLSLVTGSYGAVSVSRSGKAIVTHTDNPKVMREAAATLIAMADELEGKA